MELFIKREIFQGDKMSPTLFCVALTILKAQKSDTVELHSIESFKEGRKLTVNKICYMDDIKVFGASLEHLEQKVSSIQKLSRMIGLEFNDSKNGVVDRLS